jgi:hypothetical protein
MLKTHFTVFHQSQIRVMGAGDFLTGIIFPIRIKVLYPIKPWGIVEKKCPFKKRLIEYD